MPDLASVLLVLVVLAAVLAVVSAPLRRVSSPEAGEGAPELGDLEAAREAKYREIRDAELDLRTGKLSQQDYEAIDGTLRAQAVEILRQLDHAQGR